MRAINSFHPPSPGAKAAGHPTEHPGTGTPRRVANPIRPGAPRSARRGGAWLWGLSLALTVGGYPPMPDHILYGQVRDELGHPLRIEQGMILLETALGTQLRTLIIPGFAPGINYRLPVPMDAGLTADLYQPTALRPTVPFKLRVQIGNATYLPIEMRGDYTNLGAPATRTRLDLTLGEDTDSDGLPDAWERALIAASGLPLTLADIRPGDDFDGDGLSNLAEYLAGTYAFVPEDGFRLDLIATDGETAALEFLALPGRTYTVFTSADLEGWQPLAFRVAVPGAASGPYVAYHATDVRRLRVEPLRSDAAQRFFKVQVQ